MEQGLCKVGVGLRSTHYPHLEKRPQVSVDWFEAVSENYMDTLGRPREILEKVRGDFPIALHGVGMNIANPEGVSEQYLNRLAVLVDRIEPFLISDHFCWSGTNAHGNLHDLLPLPFTEETLDVICKNIDWVQTKLKRQLAFENVSTYLRFKSSEMTEWEFISEIVKRTQCKLLLDVNNLYVNAINHRFDPKIFIESIPCEQVEQFHLAGHTDKGDFLFDTHSAEVCDAVWGLFEYTLPKLRAETPILIEWDDHIPEFETVENEALKAKLIWERVHG